MEKTIKNIRITPFNTIYFGAGRPFSMGEESYAPEIFPPFPSTLYGMLRNLYFKNNLNDFIRKDLNTKNDPTVNLEIDFLGLELNQKKTQTLIFPLPLDLVLCNATNFIKLDYKPVEDETISENTFTHKLIYSGTEKVRSTNGEYYITFKEFNNYLNGKIDELKLRVEENEEQEKEFNTFKLSHFLLDEPKIGILRDRFNFENKHLYRINQKRLENTNFNSINFRLSISNLDLPDNNYINRLGGEGKLVQVKNTETKFKFTLPVVLEKDKATIKMYLATPAVFENGSMPCLPEEITITAAVIGKKQTISGWDLAFNKPKPYVNVTPAGSVYYLEGEAKKLQEFINAYHGKKLTQIDTYAKQGFGLVFFAKL
ncbi:type III-B CRISPR module-associated protein Cmr3 [Lutibacter maritimus]|uniref:CRISPR-associated protein Cmr3 n=1 Tax=Lutibacter maritimus TaxID=593133 RepID=A0A1I6SR07_9FLAO|nr:type III-B CRISPR module-associated protein Cmr3 [Lutibacter maritimus]SFS79343.1 CRISPR-associated protein Cmr3 [Lutibacter maritimus]